MAKYKLECRTIDGLEAISAKIDDTISWNELEEAIANHLDGDKYPRLKKYFTYKSRYEDSSWTVYDWIVLYRCLVLGNQPRILRGALYDVLVYIDAEFTLEPIND